MPQPAPFLVRREEKCCGGGEGGRGQSAGWHDLQCDPGPLRP